LETGNDKNIPTAEMPNLKDSCRGTMSANVNLHLAVTVMLSLVLSSCASTQLSHTWRDPSYVSGPLKTILVVAVRKNQQTRRAWEDGFATALSEHGVAVTPSYRFFPETLPDTGLIHRITSERSFDGIMLVGRASSETKEGVTAKYDITSPTSPSNPWDESYYGYYSQEYYPGYPVFDEIVKDEIKVWATQGGARMIWTGVGEVEGSGAYEDVRRAIIHLIVPELVKQGVIAPGS
jgi:hypothetical protein